MTNNEERPANMPFSIQMCDQIHIVYCIHYVMHGSQDNNTPGVDADKWLTLVVYIYKNMLEDSDGGSLLKIFSNPNTGHPREFLLPQDRKRNQHSCRDRFPGTPRAEPMPT